MVKYDKMVVFGTSLFFHTPTMRLFSSLVYLNFWDSLGFTTYKTNLGPIQLRAIYTLSFSSWPISHSSGVLPKLKLKIRVMYFQHAKLQIIANRQDVTRLYLLSRAWSVRSVELRSWTRWRTIAQGVVDAQTGWTITVSLQIIALGVGICDTLSSSRYGRVSLSQLGCFL